MKLKLLVVLCVLSTAGLYAQSSGLSILTQGDGLPCDPQHGEKTSYYSSGCCGAPGRRVCPLVLHAGKGPFGYSAGCTDPDSNLNHSGVCYVNPVTPEAGAVGVQRSRPVSGRDVRFVVTSDLHYFRSTYNVADQTEHVKRINAYGAQKQIAGVVLAGDMVTGGGKHKLGGYRLMWESGTIPDSIKFPVYPGMGNHDTSAQGDFGMGNDPQGALDMWSYMYARTKLFNVDRNPKGCLVGIDPLCLDYGILGGSLNYSWDWLGVHFVQLHTWAGDKDREYTPILGMDGLAWLKRDLEYRVGNSGRPVILVQHYSFGKMTGNYDSTTTPITTVAEQARLADILEPYNIAGVFAGHTHRLNIQQDLLTTSAGKQLFYDNFVDGNGGDCTVAGTGTDGTCSDATGNFLGVRLTDKFMEVSANSWSTSKATYLDRQMGFRGYTSGTGPKGMGATVGNSGAVCRKRIEGTPVAIPTSEVSMTINGNLKQITVQNNSGRNISDVAFEVTGGLYSWDYSDICASLTIASQPSPKQYLTIAANLQPGQIVQVPFDGISIFTGYSPRLVSFAYQLSASPSQLAVPAGGANIDVTAIGGANTAFTITKDQPWIYVTTNSNTTPATLTVNVTAQAAYAPGTITLTPADSRFTPLQIPVTVPNQPLNIASNLQGASVTVNGALALLPTSNLVAAPGSTVTLQATDLAVSPGTQYRFQGWTPSGSNPQQIVMPPKPVSLTARFNAFYALTLASNPPNGGQVTVVNPSSDGYYGANLLVTLSVKAAPGFVFSGFSGDLTGTNTKFGMSGPMAITANFLPAPPPPVNSNPNPMITFQSNVALPIPIIVGNTTSAMPFARTFAPGALSVSVPKDYARPDMPGVRYLFTQWSDGVSTPSRSLAVGPTAIALTALYVQQVHVQVRADPAPAGSVSGGGWYDVGSNATVTATANVGAAFVQFSGSTQSSSNPVTFAVASSPMAVVANFQRTQ